MQTTKFLFVIGTAVILTAPLTVTAGPDTEAQAKLREAMRQKMAEMDGKTNPAPTPAATPAPVVKAPTVVVPVPDEPVAPAPVVAPKANSKFSDVADPADEAAAAKLREALRQQLTTTPQPAPVAPAAPAKPKGNAPAPVFSAPPVATAAAAPASPLTGSKQDRLAELLRRYKADAITPQEYHTQRAKILAE